MDFRSNKARISLFAVLVFVAFLGTAYRSCADALIIPEAVTSIEDGAFSGDTRIQEVVFPSGLETIGSYAFSGCTGLRYVSIPDTVTAIGEHAFSECGGPLLLTMAAESPGVAYALADGIDFQAETRYRALLIGQCAYQTMPRLTGPRSDVAAMSAMLGQYSGTPYEIQTGTDLTAAEVLSLIRTTFADAGLQDVSLFYFSGHGGESSDDSLRGALMGVDGEPVTVAALKECMDDIPGRKIVVLDACFSGQFIGRGKAATAEDAFNLEVIRTFSKKENGRGIKSDNLAEDRYYVLTAAHSMQTSSEYTSGGKTFGVFTYSLCKGCGYDLVSDVICTKAADTDGDGTVTVLEAYRYALVTAQGLNSRQTAQVWPENCCEFGWLR